MNFLPSLQKPRRNFKFSNPLSGQLYNNNAYLKQCHYELEEQLQGSCIPMSTAHRANFKTTGSLAKTSYASRLHGESRRSSKHQLNRTAGSHLQMARVQKVREDKEREAKANDKYCFPDIEVKVLDAIKSSKDCKSKVLKINMSHYFGVFFKKALLGHLTADFVACVEKYVQRLLKKGALDEPIIMKDHLPDVFKIDNKKTFVSRIHELEEKGQYSTIQAMVKFYCVPDAEFRASCMKDIIHMLSRSLFQKFNMNKEKEYIILSDQGEHLSELCQITFSTKVLLISDAHNYEKAFLQYQDILLNKGMSLQKISFSEGLKKTFRTKIAGGKIDEDFCRETINQTESAHMRVKRAEDLLHKKSEKSLKAASPAKTTTNFSPPKIKSAAKQRSKSTLAHNISPVSSLPFSARKRNIEYHNNFQQLINQNSQYDITFNHINENKLLMLALIDHSHLFKNKSKAQSEAILRALQISGKESIEWEEFRKLNEVANCKGNRDDIVEFINRYLPFNEYGELDYASLKKTMDFILGGSANRQVVEDVIWSWLQKNGLVENGVVLRSVLESWYEKNKLAYVMLVSMIFGTNQISSIDMAYEVLL